jgi:hypothetical protein
MDLSDALPIIQQYTSLNAVLQADHICTRLPPHTLAACPFGATAVYTIFDALIDKTPETLQLRLQNQGTLKPPP